MKFFLPYLLETYYNTGTFQRPDSSGIRGHGVGAKEKNVSDDSFPYGGFSIRYGQPDNVRSRDSGRHSPSRTYDIEEVMGIPFDIGKSNRGTAGAHTGGRVLPGTSGEWGGRPKGGHWDNQTTDDELSGVVERVLQFLKRSGRE